MVEKYRLKKALNLPGAACALMLFMPCIYANTERDSLTFHPVPLDQLASTNPADGSVPIAPRHEVAGNPDGIVLPHAGDSALDVIAREIQRLEQDFGPYHEEISEQSVALGDQLQLQNRHQDAIDAYQEGLHIIRVNKGLHDLEQIAILEKIIDSHLALNDYRSADEVQSALLYLQQQHYADNDPGIIPALTAWADWNVTLFLDGTATRRALPGPSSTTTGEAREGLNLHLVEARKTYIQVITLIQATNDQPDPRLVETERKLAGLSYLVNQEVFDITDTGAVGMAGSAQFNANRRTLEQAHSAHFFNGSNALKRAIAYSMNSPEPEYLRIAENMMELGDWYLLFDRRAAALLVYKEAFEVLAAVNAPDDEINRIMSPGMPVETPVAVIQSLTSGDTASFEGYIDIEFQVSKYGIASNPEIIGASAQDIKQIRKALIRQLRRDKFRPGFIDGSASSKENVKLRYYYSYN